VEPVEGDAQLLDVAEPGLVLCGLDPLVQGDLDAAQLTRGGWLNLQEVAADEGVFVAAAVR